MNLPGWWSSQVFGRKDPYEAWYPDVMVAYHLAPKSMQIKKRFRLYCKRMKDHYGIYYDVLQEQTDKPHFFTVYKLYGQRPPAGIKLDLTQELLPLLRTRAMRGDPSWIRRWKAQHKLTKKQRVAGVQQWWHKWWPW